MNHSPNWHLANWPSSAPEHLSNRHIMLKNSCSAAVRDMSDLYAEVALRSASTRLRPLPWSRAAWPAWTHTLSCCLSSAPCPPSTPEIGPQPLFHPWTATSSVATSAACPQPTPGGFYRFLSPLLTPSHIPQPAPSQALEV